MLEEIKQRLSKVEEEEWYTPEEVGKYSDKTPVDHEGCEVWPWNNEDDMKFAYKSPKYVRFLLQELDKLEQENERKNKALNKFADSSNWMGQHKFEYPTIGICEWDGDDNPIKLAEEALKPL